MDFNGINSYAAYNAATFSAKNVTSTKASYSADEEGNVTATASKSAYSEVAATYESSSEKVTSAKEQDRSAIIAHIKAENEARMAQMQTLVTQMFEKQGFTIGTADDMWKILASGNFTADPETIAQAKEDISEDGYWGVKQTSERIFSFAMALSGGDEKTMQSMVKAVEKGFGEATKTWGKELPDITKDTHSAIMDKFDKWFEEQGSTATTEQLLNS
ncbi:MAG: hypothetical protein IJB96_08695 [Lachnospira sp.]|nr:hypothetical protein [Lachnospira sp.]